MRRRKESPSDETPSRHRPGATPDARESQMIDLADQLAERQLRDGSASAQVITHYLRLGSSRERIEQEKLALETELVKAKTEAIANAQKTEELYREALQAMRSYSGQPSPVESDGQGYED